MATGAGTAPLPGHHRLLPRRGRRAVLWVVPLGAHGTPGHAHHRDQLPLWLRGELAPVVTDFALLAEEPDD
ncbi:penicillin acylase family protein [Streptomyces tauricus]